MLSLSCSTDPEYNIQLVLVLGTIWFLFHCRHKVTRKLGYMKKDFKKRYR